jgi:hypothetical protein
MGIRRPEWLVEQVERVLETLNEGVIVSDDGARIILRPPRSIRANAAVKKSPKFPCSL